MAQKKRAIKEGMTLKGFARIQVHEYGPKGEPFHRLVSDTGVIGPNQKTNVGFQNFINYVLGSSAGSLLVGFAGIGTGGTPASSATALGGETMARQAVTYSAPASTTAQWVASWASSDISGSFTVGNAGLFNSSSGGSLAFGKSTPGQTVNTNQSVSLTYQLSLS